MHVIFIGRSNRSDEHLVGSLDCVRSTGAQSKRKGPLLIMPTVLGHQGFDALVMEGEIGAQLMDALPRHLAMCPMWTNLGNPAYDVHVMEVEIGAPLMDALPLHQAKYPMRTILGHQGFDAFVMEEDAGAQLRGALLLQKAMY